MRIYLFVFIFLCIGALIAQPVHSFGTEYFKHDTPVRGVAFSPDGQTIVSGNEKSITIWERSTGKKLKTLSNVEHGIVDLAYTVDGTKLALEDSC